jgi:hypothetical protein
VWTSDDVAPEVRSAIICFVMSALIAWICVIWAGVRLNCDTSGFTVAVDCAAVAVAVVAVSWDSPRVVSRINAPKITLAERNELFAVMMLFIGNLLLDRSRTGFPDHLM